MPQVDPCRRWTFEIARLRQQAEKVRRGRPSPSPVELIETCLSSFEALVQEFAAAQWRCEVLMKESQRARDHLSGLLQRLPIAWLEVTGSGVILSANRHAGEILNMSAKHLESRLLMHFAEDREQFASVLCRLPADDRLDVSLTIRPRERAVLAVDATIIVGQTDDPEPTWLWFLSAASMAERGSAKGTYTTRTESTSVSA
jgi:PAS domain-containing protein